MNNILFSLNKNWCYFDLSKKILIVFDTDEGSNDRDQNW